MERRRVPDPMLPGYRFGPLSGADLPAVAGLIAAENQHDGVEDVVTLASLERTLLDVWSPLESDSIVARDESGRAVAYARVFAKPVPVSLAFADGELHCHPDHRGTELEPRLLEWVLATGRARLAGAAAALEPHLRIHCDERQAGKRALFERFGFVARRVFWRMRRDLAEPIPAVELPDGLELSTYRPELDAGLMEAFNETFGDHWGFEPILEEDWRVFFTGNSEFRGDLTRVLLEGGEIVGYSLNYHDPEECGRLGEQRGWIGQLGVCRSWRKRGLAKLLLCVSMQAFQDAGLESAILGVDAENLTGAVAIYERVGFKPIRRVLLFARDPE